jgi:hypothetical protein
MEAIVSTATVSIPFGALPGVEEVFGFAEQEVALAAAELWPGSVVELGEHVPSVTGYVRRTVVDGRELYAKYAFLGVSLVSLLRGACGGWPQVVKDQRAYVARPDALLEREAAQLRLLGRTQHLKVCPVAGVARGVLFTESACGPTLGKLLLGQPETTAPLLQQVFTELHPLHHPRGHGLISGAAIGERSIAGTFLRKFNGISGPAYVEQLGAGRCELAERGEVVRVLRRCVARLRRLRTAVLPAARGELAYGDLKPEHVVFPNGPGSRAVFIDPGLLQGGPVVDAAKVISRIVQLLAATRPGPDAAENTLGGVALFTQARLRGLDDDARAAWLRELVTLWLMDSVNIVTTYLSAPPALPLPAHGEALLRRIVPVIGMVESISKELADDAHPRTLFESALHHARRAAS